MLGHLARYLRAAGFDTRLARDGWSDARIVREAAAEDRWVITLDRRMATEQQAARRRIILLTDGLLDGHAATLTRRLGLDWLSHAFTRCLLDNSPLAAAEPHRPAPYDLPPGAGDVKRCPTCDRFYWHGSHYRRMLGRLATWQAAERRESSGHRHECPSFGVLVHGSPVAPAGKIVHLDPDPPKPPDAVLRKPAH